MDTMMITDIFRKTEQKIQSSCTGIKLWIIFAIAAVQQVLQQR